MPQSWPVLIVGIVLGLISLSLLGCLVYAIPELDQFDPLEKPDPDSSSWVSEEIYSNASDAARENNLDEVSARMRAWVEMKKFIAMLSSVSSLILIGSIYVIYSQLKRTDFENDPQNG